jgi:uncharacterized iron-regulated protein
MATTSILRSRRTAGQLHALASVEREIRAVDRASGRKYIRNFQNAYRTYQNVLSSEDVLDNIAQSGVVLVGDYHALPNSQKYVAALFENADLQDREIVLGIETIFARDQHILDEWQQGEIDEAELRQRIRFELDWGYDWAAFYELLCAARNRGSAIYGLDCMPREDLRKIGARDRHAADKVVEIRRQHPDALLLVLFGESHLAPQHLPALLQQQLPDERFLTVLLNVDALYWRAAGEAHDHVEAVSVRDDVVCVFDATPLEKYENYRLFLDRWRRDDDGAPDLAPTFYNLIDGMVRFLGINQYSPHNTTQPRLLVDAMPEVYSRNSDTLLKRLLSRKGFSAQDRRSLLRRIRERGSVYLAPINALYVRQFHMTTSAEDATRFLHQACRGLPSRSAKANAAGLSNNQEDLFYLQVLEHALAFFGSRILYPARPPLRDNDLAGLLDVTREDLEHETALAFTDAVEAIQYITQHRDRYLCVGVSTRRRCTPDFLPVATFAGRKQEYILERLGYLLGTDLYDAYIEGRVNTGALRKLFLTHIERPGVARDTYLQLSKKLGGK